MTDLKKLQMTTAKTVIIYHFSDQISQLLDIAGTGDVDCERIFGSFDQKVQLIVVHVGVSVVLLA